MSSLGPFSGFTIANGLMLLLDRVTDYIARLRLCRRLEQLYSVYTIEQTSSKH